MVNERPEQFVVHLDPCDGRYFNFFNSGEFDELLKTARLIQRFDLGEQRCVLVFEREDGEWPAEVDCGNPV